MTDIDMQAFCLHIVQMEKLKTITLRNVPPQVLRSLQARARRNGRSVQRELLGIVYAATIDRDSLQKHLAQLRGKMNRPMSLDDIHQAIDEGRP